MDKLDKFRYQDIFGAVSHSIENKRTEFSGNFRAYIDDAKKFIHNTIKGLESVMSRGAHFSVKDLHKIVESTGYKCSNASRKDIQNMITGFEKTAEQLSRLEKNPKRFYDNTKDAKQLLDFCNKMRDLYEDDYQTSKY